MDGIAIMDQDILGIETEVRPATPSQQSFAHSVQLALQRYFTQLEGAEPADLYNLVLAEMELPLLKMVMRYTNYNQSKAAKVLGLSRGTLRKKLATYRLNERR